MPRIRDVFGRHAQARRNTEAGRRAAGGGGGGLGTSIRVYSTPLFTWAISKWGGGVWAPGGLFKWGVSEWGAGDIWGEGSKDPEVRFRWGVSHWGDTDTWV